MSRLLSRRRFVQSAAVTSAVLPAGISWAAGAAGASDEKPLTFACIGMGGQMRNYLVPELSKLDQQIVAICDVDRQQIEAAQKMAELAEARVYADYRDLLAKESGVDGVIIGTPDHWHVPICQAALAAGKHVYCEKPLAHSVAAVAVLKPKKRPATASAHLKSAGSASRARRLSSDRACHC